MIPEKQSKNPRNAFNTGLHLDIYKLIPFKLDRHYSSILFDLSLNDLDLHLRSPLYEKAETSALIFFKTC